MTRRDLLAEARRILALAWPVALTQLQWILLNATDTALVGRYSTAELGAMGAGRAIIWVVVVMGIAGLSGVLVFAGRADGAGAPAQAGRALQQGLALAAAYGTCAAAIIFLGADGIVAAMGVAPELADSAALYARVLVLGLPFQLAFSTASFFMEGISRPRIAMTVNLATLPVNALLAWALINGHGPFAPMGAAGAALGTALTGALSAGALLWLVRRMPDAGRYGVQGLGMRLGEWRRAWVGGTELRRFALAPAIAAGFELAGFSLLMADAARQSAAASSAFQAAIALHMISLAASTGLASAAGVRVANAVGEGQPAAARERALIAAGIAAATLVAFGLVCFLFAPALIGPFSDDPAVVPLGAAMLRVFAPFLIGDGVQFVFLYALRSLGDQKAAGVISTVSFFGVMGLGGMWLAGPAGLGPLGLAWGVSAGIVAAFAGLGLRFLWRTRVGAPALAAASN